MSERPLARINQEEVINDAWQLAGKAIVVASDALAKVKDGPFAPHEIASVAGEVGRLLTGIADLSKIETEPQGK